MPQTFSEKNDLIADMHEFKCQIDFKDTHEGFLC